MCLEFGNNKPGAGFSSITEEAMLALVAHTTEERETWAKTMDKEREWGKVLAKDGRAFPLCSMTPLVVLLVPHEEANRVEGGATVWGSPGDQWAVKVTAIRGLGRLPEGWASAAPLSRAPH